MVSILGRESCPTQLKTAGAESMIYSHSYRTKAIMAVK